MNAWIIVLIAGLGSYLLRISMISAGRVRLPSRFDEPLGLAAPAAFASDPPEYVAARLRAVHPDEPGWGGPVVAYFRRAADGWLLVGLERNP